MEGGDQIGLFLGRIEEAFKNKGYSQWIAYSDKLLNMLGREISVDAEDIVHDIIIKTIENKRKYRSNISIDAYMKMSMKSEVNNLIKKEKRTISLYPDDDYNPLGVQNFCEVSYLYEDTIESLKKCLAILNEIESLILLCKLEGKNSGEICGALGITKKKYYYHCRSYKNKIRKHFMEKGESRKDKVESIKEKVERKK